jgi:His-Xaa-Ser system protein HxsD
MTPEGVERRAEAVPPVRLRGDGLIALDIDRELFSMDAVLRSSYKFTDRCHIFIQAHETRMDRWTVVIRPKNADPNVIELAGDFSNELIDQRLRERLEQQFGDVRTLIVAQAFAEGNLLDAAGADDDYASDPQRIGRLRP